MPKLKVDDLCNKVFGRLTVLRRVGSVPGGSEWECRCSCGNKITTLRQSILSGCTKSCGCLRKQITHERHATHLMSGTKPYYVHNAMMRRCYEKRNAKYKRYGNRGIRVVKAWHRFEGFWKDMGDSYRLGLSLDRINNNGPYSKSNCRWATKKEQQRNTSKTGKYSFMGKMVSLMDISERMKITPKALYYRVKVKGMSVKSALKEING